MTSLDRLRWITFGHLEADECGAMNLFLAAAPDAQVAHGVMGCMVSLNDLADRPPVPLADGQVLELGAHRVRHIDTPHVPHGWEARVLFEESTGTLLCGDLFTQLGDPPALTTDDVLAGAADGRGSLPRQLPRADVRAHRPLPGRAGAVDPGRHARVLLQRRRAARCAPWPTTTTAASPPRPPDPHPPTRPPDSHRHTATEE